MNSLQGSASAFRWNLEKFTSKHHSFIVQHISESVGVGVGVLSPLFP